MRRYSDVRDEKRAAAVVLSLNYSKSFINNHNKSSLLFLCDDEQKKTYCITATSPFVKNPIVIFPRGKLNKV